MEPMKPVSSSAVTLEFSEQEVITSKELSTFFYFFRTLYGLSLGLPGVQGNDVEGIVADEAKYLSKVELQLRIRSAEELQQKYYLDDLGDEELLVERINKESPLLIVFTGVVAAMALAAILSGGEMEAQAPGGFGFKFKLPPLAEGLGKLMDLFHSEEYSEAEPAEAKPEAAEEAEEAGEEEEAES